MLPKKERFTRQQLEEFLSSHSFSTVYNRLGTLKYHPNGKRLAVVVSSKHEKRAVYRNKIRRRLYSLFKQFPGSLTGALYVSKQAYLYDNIQDIKKQFNDLFKKTQAISHRASE